MYTLIELWKPKAKWLEAPQAEREAFMNGVGQAMTQLSAIGVQTTAWCANDPDTSMRDIHAYFAVWQFPSLEVAKTFEATVQASGWYDYFDHSNLQGLTRTPPAVIAEHIGL
jgi:hypothetical protein